MASKGAITSSFLWSRAVKGIFRNATLAPGHILQQHLSPISIARAAISSITQSSFLERSFPVVKNEPLRSNSSLSWNKEQGTVLTSVFTPEFLQVRTYKNALRPRLICDGCYFVWRHGRKFVECSDHPRHKQVKKLLTRQIWQEDYSKGHIYKALNWHKRFPQEFLRTADRTSLSHNWLAGKLGKEV